MIIKNNNAACKLKVYVGYWHNTTYFTDMFRQVLADDEAGVSQALATEWVDGLHPQSDGVCSCYIWDN